MRKTPSPAHATVAPTLCKLHITRGVLPTKHLLCACTFVHCVERLYLSEALRGASVRLPGPIDLAATLHGGQAFRWRRTLDGAWLGAVDGVAARIEGDLVRGPEDESVRRYFRLEPADAARRARLARDPIVAPALAAHSGLRLLRQDPWETTVAFITSANNNVLRIEGILERIARRWGTPIEHGLRAFPTALTLSRARTDSLRSVGLGYRAPFVREAARLVARGEVDLEALRGEGAEEARDGLLALPGVGPKVADCIALFSLDVDDAFPVDRWVLRAMADVMGAEGDEPRAKGRRAGQHSAPSPQPSARDVTAFARARWGRDAGLAQQLLFHDLRVRERAPGTERLELHYDISD